MIILELSEKLRHAEAMWRIERLALREFCEKHGLDDERFPCLSHQLNLLLTELDLPEKSVIAKLKRLSTLFNQSPHMRSFLCVSCLCCFSGS